MTRCISIGSFLLFFLCVAMLAPVAHGQDAARKSYLDQNPRADTDGDGRLSEQEFLVDIWTKERQRKLAAVGDRVRVIENVEYARIGDRSLKLDLYLPRTVSADDPMPLVVWIHGGGWRHGTKYRCIVMWLATEGYAVASVQYRLASERHPFPQQIHDCKGAIRWLRKHDGDYGYNAAHIVASGESAGGHLASLIGTSGGVTALEGDTGGNRDYSSRVQGVINFYGPTDLDRWVTDTPSVFDMFLSFVGGGSVEQSRSTLQLHSPAHHVTSDDPPVLTLQGDADPLVPVRQVEFLHEAYETAGLESQLIIIPGAGHTGPQFEDETRKKIIREFLAKHLRR